MKTLALAIILTACAPTPVNLVLTHTQPTPMTLVPCPPGGVPPSPRPSVLSVPALKAWADQTEAARRQSEFARATCARQIAALIALQETHSP